MNGDPRDPLDDAIARDLGALAPDHVDADAVLSGLRPALQRARARRRLAVASGALGAVVVVVGAGGLLLGRSASRLNVQSHPTTLPVASSTTSTVHAPTSTTTRPQGISTSTTTATSPVTSVTPSTDDHGGTSGQGPGTTTGSTSNEAFTRTYTSVGGSVTVTFASGGLTLDASKAATGYQTEVHKQDPDDVEVRFAKGDRESRIRVRVENGAMRAATEES